MTSPHRRRLARPWSVVALIFAVVVPIAVDLQWVSAAPRSVIPMTVLAAVAALPLVASRRAPARVFWVVASTTGAGLVGLSVLGYDSTILMCLPMAAAAFHLSAHGRAPSTVRFAVALVALFAAFFVVLSQLAPSGGWGVQGAVLATMLVLLAWAGGLASRRGAEAAGHRAEIASERARTATRDERARIARDLHDGLAHRLTALVLRAESARAAGIRRGESAHVVDDLTRIADDGRRAVRETTMILDALHGSGTAADLEGLDDLLSDARARGVDIRVLRRGVLPGGEVGAALYRVVQECLANADRYGSGDGVDLSVIGDPSGTTVTVSNAVRSATATRRAVAWLQLGSGRGLPGMRECVSALDGTMRVDRPPDHFVVRVWFPASRGEPTGAPSP